MGDEQPRSRIPDFTSIEEEAEFWDTHDLSDYWDEFKPVELRVSPNLTSVFHLDVRLGKEDWNQLERLSRERETTPASLVTAWVRERLRGGEAAD